MGKATTELLKEISGGLFTEKSKKMVSVFDEVFSYCVRQRAEWRCQYSGKPYFPKNEEGLGTKSKLNTCHIVGRTSYLTRWHPRNAVALNYFWHNERFDKAGEMWKNGSPGSELVTWRVGFLESIGYMQDEMQELYQLGQKPWDDRWDREAAQLLAFIKEVKSAKNYYPPSFK